MESKKNKYKSETEFEKKEFSGLIEKLGNLDEEKVSDNFDDKFSKELDRTTIPIPVRVKIKNIFTSTSEFHPWKLYAIVSMAAVILLIFIVLPIKDSTTTDKVLTQADSTKSSLEQKSLKNETENILANENTSTTDSSAIKNKSIYLKSLINDLEIRYGLGLNKKESTSELINKVIEGELFSKSIENMKNLKRGDTLRILFEIFSGKKN